MGRNRLQIHIGSFLPPFIPVLPQWLDELAHSVCYRSKINNQKGNFLSKDQEGASIGFQTAQSIMVHFTLSYTNPRLTVPSMVLIVQC